MDLTPQVLDRLKKTIIATVPFAERTGVEIVELRERYVKMRMPFEPNVNHVGIMYAGALFTLAELPGGAIFATTFDVTRYYPIVKEMHIRFRRPATTDVTVEVELSPEQAAEIAARAEREGKADFEWECQLRDASGEVVAVSKNVYQLRKVGT
ncbi:MAG: DUF4442 domain-containing protein [Candidatus Dadabacteria bacterium]|nr:MAG: DUF4442 domain-containing protein [Candidatus Dadabacteria bacterium]